MEGAHPFLRFAQGQALPTIHSLSRNKGNPASKLKLFFLTYINKSDKNDSKIETINRVAMPFQ
jgi:hypothetical protein